VGDASQLRGWTAGAAINRDADLRLQYLAGLEADVYQGDAIYRQILREMEKSGKGGLGK